MSDVKHPEVEVQLSGNDSNAYMIIGLVVEGLRKNRVDKAEIEAFRKEAKSGDYDNVIETAMKWVTVN
jgi:hypothetical protein